MKLRIAAAFFTLAAVGPSAEVWRTSGRVDSITKDKIVIKALRESRSFAITVNTTFADDKERSITWDSVKAGESVVLGHDGAVAFWIKKGTLSQDTVVDERFREAGATSNCCTNTSGTVVSLARDKIELVPLPKV
jgi:hypothetical protein